MTDLSSTAPTSDHRAILGLDPGFASIGWCIVWVYKNESAWFLNGGVFHTEKSSKKTNVAATADNFRRAREVSSFLQRTIAENKISLVAAEAMSFPRHASNAAKMAMCWGGLAALTVVLDPLPVLQASPQRIKKVVTGRADASKEDIIKAMREKHPGVVSILDSMPKGDHEHLADALGAVVATLDSDEVRLLRSMIP